MLSYSIYLVRCPFCGPFARKIDTSIRMNPESLTFSVTRISLVVGVRVKFHIGKLAAQLISLGTKPGRPGTIVGPRTAVSRPDSPKHSHRVVAWSVRFVELREVGLVEDVVGWRNGPWVICVRRRIYLCLGRGNECSCGEVDKATDQDYHKDGFVEDDGRTHVTLL